MSYWTVRDRQHSARMPVRSHDVPLPGVPRWAQRRGERTTGRFDGHPPQWMIRMCNAASRTAVTHREHCLDPASRETVDVTQ